VSLELYVKICRGIAPYGFDQAKLPHVARAFGIPSADWQQAHEGWTARIQTDPKVSALFNEYYSRP
jgi:hypothetical protein